MKRPSPRSAVVGAALWAALAALAPDASIATDAPGGSAADPGVHAFAARRIDGSEQSLASYRGRVLLIVNVASQCGLTPQYEGLEALYERYRERGFEVLGFPANDFAGQEPGSDAEIADFCRSSYGVEFPMFSKIHVVGPAMHPLYRHLTGQPEPVGGPVRWNFQKYLVDGDGRVVARFDPRVDPQSSDVVRAIESLLPARD